MDFTEAYRLEKIELKKLRAHNKALREALEAVEWVDTYLNGDECPSCYCLKGNSHAPDCKLSNTLKLVRGK